MLIKLVLFCQLDLSLAFFIARISDLSKEEGKSRIACLCLCGMSNIPACLSYKQTGTQEFKISCSRAKQKSL